MIPEMPVIQHDDIHLMQIQTNAKKVLDALSKSTIYDAQIDTNGKFQGNFGKASGGATFQIADSVLLRGLVFSIASNPTPINHGLGRTPTGYVVCRLSAAATVLDHAQNTDPTKNPDPTKILILQATAACTVSLLVF